jgi:hypothetical protein
MSQALAALPLMGTPKLPKAVIDRIAAIHPQISHDDDEVSEAADDDIVFLSCALLYGEICYCEMIMFFVSQFSKSLTLLYIPGSVHGRLGSFFLLLLEPTRMSQQEIKITATTPNPGPQILSGRYYIHQRARVFFSVQISSIKGKGTRLFRTHYLKIMLTYSHILTVNLLFIITGQLKSMAYIVILATLHDQQKYVCQTVPSKRSSNIVDLPL